MDINRKIQAASHSGATLNIIRTKGHFSVQKKIFNSLARNKTAIEKQINFQSIMTSTYEIIAIPVTSLHETENELVVEMPYIEGVGGDVISNKGNRNTAKNIQTSLNSYLIDSLAKSKITHISKNVFLNKLDDIERNIKLSEQVLPSAYQAITYLKKECSHDFSFPIGPCHGDLTLSNIKITQEKKLYLFDFLDGFIESPLQDAVKLLQDMVYGWSFRKEKSSLRLKGELFCEVAYPTFIDNLILLYPREMKVLEIMTILRIAPFINEADSITIDWFNESLSKSLIRL